MAKVRKHVIIKGRVQGVFFRATTQDRALALGLTGWVRNTRAVNVEAVFEGEEENAAKLLRWCQRGPPGAVVKEVQVKSEVYTGEFSTFSIEYSRW
ncbi:Acylphosphatase [subsurface metagenome]